MSLSLWSLMVEAVEYERAEQQLVQVVLWRRAYSPRIAYVGVSPVRVVGLVRSLKTDEGGGPGFSLQGFILFYFSHLKLAVFSCSGCFLSET